MRREIRTGRGGRLPHLGLLLLGPTVVLLCLPGFASAAGCSNEAFRTGPSASLPDCRAYELVSPPDSNGRLLQGISYFGFEPLIELFPTELASPQRDSFIYMTFNTPLLDPKGATGSFDLYEAERSAGGWQTTRRLSPSGEQAVQPLTGGVTPDREYAFLRVAGLAGRPGGSLAAIGMAAYLRNPDGSFELTGVGSLGTERYAQGRYISPGGEHVIFSTGKAGLQSGWCALESGQCQVRKLEENAAPSGTGTVYDREADGETRVISLLPGNVPQLAGEEAFFQGASMDGSVVAFKIKGVLYLRVDNAVTVEVAAGDPTYAGLYADGRYVFYIASGNIHRFDTEDKSDEQINLTGDGELVNVSADGSHAYFISEAEIGGEGKAGEPNLYVWSGAAIDYIATVVASDLETTSGPLLGFPALTNWTDWAVAPSNGVERGPGAAASRTTSDGSVLVFESRAQLTAYDNNGHTEIYRFDDAADGLVCVSCNQLAEPASGDARLQEVQRVRPGIVIHNLSADGNRVFFESPDALVGADTGDTNDIYEWQKEEGGGTSLDLISSGKSLSYPPLLEQVLFGPSPNILLGITPSGNDVFFHSQDALVPGAGTGGTSAIYDARVNGGFPVEVVPTPCREDNCKPSPSSGSPVFSGPRSEATGTGNLKLRKKRCRRGVKHRRHRRCHKARSRAQVSQLRQGPIRLWAREPQPPSADAEETDASMEVEGNSANASALATSASSEFDGWGIEFAEAELSSPAAGMHRDFTTGFGVTHHINKLTGEPEADARAEEISVLLPPGLLGNPNAIPQCKTGELVAFANCPIDSQVGVAKVLLSGFPDELTEPVYNLQPPHPEREVARFGFYPTFPVFIDINVRTAGDYGVTATVHSSPGQAAILEATTTLWGDPADSSHDPQRLTALEATQCLSGTACKTPQGERDSNLPATAFMTNPSACQPMSVDFIIKSYQRPGQVFSAAAPMDSITSCAGLPFEPSFEATSTNPVAGAPTGLKTTLLIPQRSSEAVGSPATATMREARITLPEGMQIAAGAANWIGVCSEEQVGFHGEVDAACPDASKLGEATIVSPSLPRPLHGWLYQRTPSPGHPFGLWLIADELGLHVKLPGELEPDPRTGRLTAVFGDLPQVPVSEVTLNIWGGSRAPLKNPDACGTYSASYAFAPHSDDPVVTGQSQMTIDQGCQRGFSPTLHAGVTYPRAGKFSPLIIDLAREDGQQSLRGFELTLPDGELAKLKGVPHCPEALVKSGACPANSKIGYVNAAAGPGPEPLWLPQPGKAPIAIYLAGPYAGSPFSLVTAVPAQAGPFDLGTLVVRSGLDVDRETGRAVVKADPLPQFFEGVATAYRRIHAVIDRPRFALNPTDCREMAVNARVASNQGALATPSSHFQVDGCRALEFKPQLSLRLSGGTKRSDYPALEAVLKARKGDANLGRVSVALPHSEFLAQEHIETICTRKRFAANNCPKRSIYGKVKVWTPLLARPLRGPVYLRSSDNPLPDLVMDLHGEINMAVAGRIDSVRGGIRTTFASVPDAPITKFVLRMKGGSKGLLVNSTDVCRGRHRSMITMRAQNGRRLGSRPVLEAKGCRGGRF